MNTMLLIIFALNVFMMGFNFIAAIVWPKYNWWPFYVSTAMSAYLGSLLVDKL